MKIEELNGQEARIGKTSITVYNPETAKTAAVITGIKELRANQKSQLWTTYRAAIGTEAAAALAQTYETRNGFYYIYNILSEKERATAEALHAAGIKTANYTKVIYYH